MAKGKLLGMFAGLAEVRGMLVDKAGTLKKFDRSVLLHALKEAGFQTLEHWHAVYAPRHFKTTALFEYPPYAKYYGGLRRRARSKRPPKTDAGSKEKLPLVDSGSLRYNALRPISRGRNFSGTAGRTKLVLQYGRPGAVELRIQDEIARLMDKYGMSRKKAVAQAYAHAGYSPKMKDRFQELISHVSAAESRTMVTLYKKLVVGMLKHKGVRIEGVTR